MSTLWLNEQLSKMLNVATDNGNPILVVTFGQRSEKVYSPNPSEYAVTADVVRKAADLGATIIAYSDSWCEVTYEGAQYSKELGISVTPYKSFFAYLRKFGVNTAT